MIRTCVLVLTVSATSGVAQWLNHPAPCIPRLPDGKPNLSARTPRTADGKPDLYGIWEMDATFQDDPFFQGPAHINELKPEDIMLTPEGEALQRQQLKGNDANCLPRIFAAFTRTEPFKIFAIKETVVLLYEAPTIYRQIFMDGRELPKDPNPTWLGYSVGKWDGDTLVVETSGFNDRGLLPGGRTHSSALHIFERYRRPDFGHLEIQYKIDDPKIYAKPWTITQHHHLTPDTELLEYICNENEKDLKHIVGAK